MPTYVKDEIRCITEDMRQRILPAQLERRVYEQLRDEILSGTLTTGAQLVEARIATDLGVSKTPVREALIRLQRDGLVEIEPYRGARVIEPAETDIREILELRILLECHITRDLASRRPPEALDSLERTIEEGRQALQTGDETKRQLGADRVLRRDGGRQRKQAAGESPRRPQKRSAPDRQHLASPPWARRAVPGRA